MTEIWKAEFILQSADVKKIEHQLWEVFENLCLYRHDDDETKHSVEVTYEGDQNKAGIEEKLKILCANVNIETPAISFEKIPDINWLEHVYDTYPPVVAGRFFVHGGHVTEYPADKIEISLNAATAFGTGEHGTTKGCLLALDELLDAGSFKKPLDMGCGAGVLAIAMAKVLQRKIIAIDNQDEAVRVIMKNASINNVAEYIRATCGDGFNTQLTIDNAPYDLITANILAGPLVEMAPSLVTALDKSGTIVLSGILQTQEEWVVGAYENLGCSVIKTYPIDEWQTIVLRKNDK